MNINRLKKFSHNSFPYFLSFLAAFSFNEYLFGSEPMAYKNGIIGIFTFGILLYFSRKRPASQTNEKYLRKLTFIFSAVIAFFIVIGTSIYRTDTLNPLLDTPFLILKSMFLVIGMTWMIFIFLERLVFWFHTYEWSCPKTNSWKWFGDNKQSLLLVWGVILLCWLPYFLAYFPGIFSYDAPAQLWQAEHPMELNDHNPLVHTLLIKLCLSIGGSRQNCILVHSIIQMLIMSFIFSYVIYQLSHLHVHYKIRIASLVWFALCPFNAIFSMVAAKDVLCGGFLVLLTILMIDMVKRPQEFFQSIPKQIFLALSCFLFSLFRNNALYAALFAALLTLIIYRKYWKGILRTLGVGVFAAWIIMNPLYTVLDLKYESSEEMLSVPAHQVAWAAKNHWDELTEEERETLNIAFDNNAVVWELHNPRLADTSKNFLKKTTKEEFFSIWRKFLIKYPVDYIEAFLNLNLLSWYPDAGYPDQHIYHHYIEDDMANVWGDGEPVERRTLSQPLLSLFETFPNHTAQWMDLPLISTLCSVGTPIYILLLALILLLAKKKNGMTAALLPSIALWLTFLLGPISLIRYHYPLIAAYPLYLALAAMAAKGAMEGKK